MTKENLCRYTLLNGETERLYMRLAELEVSATNESIMEAKELRTQIEKSWAEMRAIHNAIDALDNPMERVVLHMRYTDGDPGQLTPWKEIANWIYGSTAAKNMHAVYRLHKRALESIGKASETGEDEQ